MQDVYRRTGKVAPDGRRGIVDRAAYMSFLESQLERVTVCVLCYGCVLLELALRSVQQCCDRESAGLDMRRWARVRVDGELRSRTLHRTSL